MTLRINQAIKPLGYNYVYMTRRAEIAMQRFNKSTGQRLQRLLHFAGSKMLKGHSIAQTERILARHDLFAFAQMGKMIIASPHDLSASHHGDNLFDTDLELLTFRGSGKAGLTRFLTQDQGGRAYIRIWPVARGCISFGCENSRRWIYGLSNIDLLYTAILQENNHPSEKVLYGWSDKERWGERDFADVYYTLARLNSSSWHVLPKPTTLVSRSPQAEAKADTARMVSFLLKKKNGKSFERDFTIITTSINQRITYNHQGREYSIYGFKRYDHVRLVIKEQTDQNGNLEKIGTFHGYNNGDIQSEPIGIYRLSRFLQGHWQLCYPPEPIVAISRQEQSKHRSRQIKEFLLNEQTEGAELELGGFYVYKNGFIRLSFSNQKREVQGLKRYAGRYLSGLLRQEGDRKVLYLWYKASSLYSFDAGPLRPQGDVIAERVDGQWRFIGTVAQDLIDKRAQNAEFVAYLLSDQGRKRHVSTWPIQHRRDSHYHSLNKTIAGQRASFYLSGEAVGDKDELVGKTREVMGRFKVVTLYNGDQPVKTAILARKTKGQWQPFIRDISQDPQGLLEQIASEAE